MVAISRCAENRPRNRLVRFVMLFFALFLVATLPAPAAAQCCGAPAQEPTQSAGFASSIAQFVKENAWLATIVDVLNGIFSFFNNILGPITNSGFAAVTANQSGNSTVIADTLYKKADFDGQYNNYNFRTHDAGTEQAKAAIPNQTQACAWQNYSQKMERLGHGGLLGQAYVPVAANECKGGTANCQGPGRPYERMRDLCKLGLAVTAENGTLYDAEGCTAPQDGYANRDLNVPAFLEAKQMPLASPCILKDGYLSFSGPPPSQSCVGGSTASATPNADVGQSQLAWVAAFKLCENLDVTITSAPFGANGRVASGQDWAEMDLDRSLSTGRVSAKSQCLQALWLRTACPSNSSDAAKAVGASETCHDDQVAVCNALKKSPNTGGAYDITGASGNPTYPPTDDYGLGLSSDPAVANCDQNGISILMIRKIVGNRCNDPSFMKSLSNNLGSGEKYEEYIAAICPKLQNDFETALREENATLSTLISNAMTIAAQNRRAGHSTSE